ncbi:MAG: hypothetical protein JWQ98_396 [Chlorobi bacterium]|nr:hypothetical protein [Chlorobiota bacterium]
MGCSCNAPDTITSWIGWADTEPQNPLDLIANATLNGTQGVFARSSNYWNPSSWYSGGNPFTLASAPLCVALGTDSQQKIADAAQWNMQHTTANLTVAPPLRKVIFLRGGLDWEMHIPLSFGASTYTTVELSFRDNAGTLATRLKKFKMIHPLPSLHMSTMIMGIG